MGMTFKIEGTKELAEALAALGPKMQEIAAGAVYEEAEDIMADSKENYVPVDTGTLKNSGHVEEPEITDEGVSVAMGYGGAAEDYAVAQHERLDYNHPTGQAKFLERPLLEAATGMAARLADRIRKALKDTVKDTPANEPVKDAVEEGLKEGVKGVSDFWKPDQP